MQKNWVFQEVEPVLDVEVSLLTAPGASIDWVHGPRRDEAIRIVVDRCSNLFAEQINGRVERVGQTDFNHHGMTLHINIVARESDQLETLITRDLGSVERALEASLQSNFGWEQAAVSVQIETNPNYEARRGRRSAPRPGNPDDINVWQPGGGSNAIAPVIVTVPTPAGAADPNPIHTLPYPPPPARQGSAAVAGLLGAVLAVSIAIMVALMIGPLTDEISSLYQQQDIVENELTLRDQEITSLERENGRLHETVSRLASRRGQPAARSDQPTRTLPDTGPSGPLAITTPSIASSGATTP